MEFVNNIYNAFENNEYSMGVFLDLSKAFDTIDHSILLAKLDFYGIRGRALDWFKSYLNNRKQYVDLNDCKSLTCSVTHGVPQGSIFSPLLFLIYINDLTRFTTVKLFYLPTIRIYNTHPKLFLWKSERWPTFSAWMSQSKYIITECIQNFPCTVF